MVSTGQHLKIRKSASEGVETTLQVDQVELEEDAAQRIELPLREVTDTPRGTSKIITEVIQAKIENTASMVETDIGKRKTTKYA